MTLTGHLEIDYRITVSQIHHFDHLVDVPQPSRSNRYIRTIGGSGQVSNKMLVIAMSM